MFRPIKNELIPIGKTLENINKNGLIEGDELLNSNYHKTKEIVDDFLRDFINKALKNVQINSWDELAEALNKNDEDNLEKIQEKIRGMIVSKFKNFDLFSAYSIKKDKKKKEDDDDVADDELDDLDDLDKGKSDSSFEYLFKKELFKTVLPAYLKTDHEKQKIISSFDNFITYFRGFFENRKNIFTQKAISTSIAYRIVHDNFPKFLSNISCFNVWQNECPQVIEKVEKSLKENNLIDDRKSLSDYFTVSSYDYFLSQEGIDSYNTAIGGPQALACQIKMVLPFFWGLTFKSN